MNDSKLKLVSTAKSIFASQGYDGLSMRTLAKASGVNLSSIYHYFLDKDVLLKAVFDQTSQELGQRRSRLIERQNARDALMDRIDFQFDNIEDIVFILKYYMHFRSDFVHLKTGFVPHSAYLHILEVLELGVMSGEFDIAKKDIVKEAKVVTHAINGFLLEYYPQPPSGAERKQVVSSIHRFVYRSLTSKEVKTM